MNVLLAPVIALIVEGLKTLVQDIAGYDVSKLAARITAYVISLALSIAAGMHLPFGIGALLPGYVQAAQPVLAALVLAALSYASHDIVLVAQNILSALAARYAPPAAAKA